MIRSRRPRIIVHDHQGCVIAAQLGSPCLGIATYYFTMPQDAMARLTMTCGCACHDTLGRTIRI